MARTSQNVQAGKRKIELSNLRKILFPEDQILKAELIQYYLQIAPTILSHIKGRPLSLVRYPNGITGEAFYQKNRPEWAPNWIEYITLGEEKKDYIIATEEASLVWLANLACIELHQMHSHKPHFDKPDYLVFDLDPPERYPFKKLVEVALELREHIEGFGYHTFVKTTGGKGIHIVVPVEPQSDFHTVFEAAREVATPFVEAHPRDDGPVQEDRDHTEEECRRPQPAQFLVGPVGRHRVADRAQDEVGRHERENERKRQ